MNELPGQVIKKREFVLLMAMMFATVAFSIDAMLPAMPEIARDLELSNPQHAPLIITIFVMGMGLGTLFLGPLSDAYGRRIVVFSGLVIYAIGATLAWFAQSLEWMLAARFVQGFGASGPRIVSSAIIRDLFSGREMARITSLALTFFLITPALAPMLGSFIMELADWRAIYGVFLLFAAIMAAWFGFRVTETLPKSARRPMRASLLKSALSEVIAHRVVRLSIIVQTLLMAELYCVLTMVQPIFDIYFDRASSFPYWIGALATAAAGATLLNARLVGDMGMRRLVTMSLSSQIALSALVLLLMLANVPGIFWIYLFWQFGVLVQAGFTTGNLNAIAMEPMGHIAGMAASVIGAISTIGGALIASRLALLFDGTPVPLVTCVLILVLISCFLMQIMRRAEARLAESA